MLSGSTVALHDDNKLVTNTAVKAETTV